MSRCAVGLLAISLLIVGCDRSGNPSPTSNPVAAPSVALLHPGRENDHGWNELACRALDALGESRHVRVQNTCTPNKATFKSDLRDYAQRGFTLVICHGSEYVKAAREVARDFPKTRFLVTGSADAGDGVATLDFRLWEASYLCGQLAAHLVPEGPAGLIGGQDFVTVRLTLDAFAFGARAVRPDYAAFTQYVGSWDDAALARQTAQSQIETRKVRVLFQNTDAAAKGVFQAAADAGLIAFGCNSDQAAIAPQVVAASAVIDMHKAFEIALDRALTADWKAEPIVGNLANGIITIALNPTFEKRWPAGAIEGMMEARRAIIAGTLDPAKPPRQ